MKRIVVYSSHRLPLPKRTEERERERDDIIISSFTEIRRTKEICEWRPRSIRSSFVLPIKRDAYWLENRIASHDSTFYLFNFSMFLFSFTFDKTYF